MLVVGLSRQGALRMAGPTAPLAAPECEPLVVAGGLQASLPIDSTCSPGLAEAGQLSQISEALTAFSVCKRFLGYAVYLLNGCR